jgi:hypothetical protein
LDQHKLVKVCTKETPLFAVSFKKIKKKNYQEFVKGKYLKREEVGVVQIGLVPIPVPPSSSTSPPSFGTIARRRHSF